MAASVIAMLPGTGEPPRASSPEVADESKIEFGVNRATHAFNDVCEGPRFNRIDDAGDGSGTFGDAADCIREFTQGASRLRSARETVAEFNPGADGQDASDCFAAYLSRPSWPVGNGGVAFGNRQAS